MKNGWLAISSILLINKLSYLGELLSGWRLNKNGNIALCHCFYLV